MRRIWRDIPVVKTACLWMCAFVGMSATGGQSATSKPLPPASRICDMSMRLVSLRLVDASGAPVSGASITVRRVRTRTMLANAEAMGGQGDYKVLEDGMLKDLRHNGEPFDVTFAKDGRTRRVRIRLGMDAGGCHVMLKSGPTRIVF
jgi:hypothetical protein